MLCPHAAKASREGQIHHWESPAPVLVEPIGEPVGIERDNPRLPCEGVSRRAPWNAGHDFVIGKFKRKKLKHQPNAH
jgi:hypothetical protein